jgi:ABC-type multidrug transport system ATPase subunit
VLLEDIQAGYGLRRRRQPILRGLDLRLEPGTSTAVVGANGAGKTTLIRILLGLLRPWSGRVCVGGRAPSEYRATGAVSYVPEEVALPPGWTVEGLVAEGARLRGYRGKRRRARTRRSLADLGLGGFVGVSVETLSRGAARRTAMAFALARRSPGLVLLDEPLGGLDAASRTRARILVARLRQRGATVLVTTHELREVDSLADTAVVLSGGRIAARLAQTELSRLEDAVRHSEPGSS